MRSDACILYLIYILLGYNRQKMSTRKSFSGHSFCKKKLRRRNEFLFIWGKLLGIIKPCCINVDHIQLLWNISSQISCKLLFYQSHMSTMYSMKIRSIDVLKHNNAHFNKPNCKIHICANWHKHIEIKRISTISLIKRYFKNPLFEALFEFILFDISER